MGVRAFDTLCAPMTRRPVIQLLLGDVVRLRRPHPCGGDTWLIDRVGADIGLRCHSCARHVLIARGALERRLVAFIERGDPALTEAAAPNPASPSA
jgi:hypothetical protein